MIDRLAPRQRPSHAQGEPFDVEVWRPQRT
jgi:hypothetical protein